MDGRERRDERPGLTVDIVLKQDQRTGRLTRGVVKDVLTKSPHHPHGIAAGTTIIPLDTFTLFRLPSVGRRMS
jgi:uncharacterized repeat protein (TIGR03833 family)